MRKSLIPMIVFSLLMIGIISSPSYSHNNSAPNMECINCHQGEMVPDMVTIEGIPKAFVPGKVYTFAAKVTSSMKSEGDVAGGFAVEVSGGELIVSDKKHTQISDGLLTHTQEGSAFRKWTFKWKAPAKREDVNVNIMAVAANGDFSAIADHVGANSYTIKPAK